ncbi:DUF1080 domain-containing protein [Luteolibacter ambystomatis]|uniref:DUF1080 domain-containing protein n=1 Tax=Luteolibacter ambystomatis TaxID=2824561 RepID=A0A975J262_9BACT|nr:DUF1080 domain-containing protein [Luteolibacter ambystomatis]QUE52657.1 DUF1080 domain-containing protein [Luteolibacter ambystomatis]
MKIRSSSALFLVCTVLGCITSYADEPANAAAAVALFDGKTLIGWSTKGTGGKATFAVEDGVIVGTSAKGGSNTFLCSDKTFRDFELEVDVKLEEKDTSYMNSGIQVRSRINEQGRVSGWQCEVDPSPRAWTCGIQEEAGRGWLQPVKPQDAKADLPVFAAGKTFKHNDWNHIKIVCEGNRIRTWLNGEAASDLTDDKGAAEGFIALQVHLGPEGHRYFFRDIKIREIVK